MYHLEGFAKQPIGSAELVGLAVMGAGLGAAAFESRRFYNTNTLALGEESSSASPFPWWTFDVHSS